MVGKSNQFSINQPVHMYYLIYQTYTGYKIRRLDEEGIIKQFLLFIIWLIAMLLRFLFLSQCHIWFSLLGHLVNDI